jgi:hypothetical protein
MAARDRTTAKSRSIRGVGYRAGERRESIGGPVPDVDVRQKVVAGGRVV